MTWAITPASLKAVCRENNLYYHKPELNDVLYLHCKGITKLENLEAFSGLKALYLEGNAISAIENIEHMAELKCLFMSKNVLHGLEGIQRLKALVTLDVSHNDLYSLAPLSKLTTLQSLNAGHNKLSGAEGIAPLQGCTQLKTLDLEKNRIESREALGAIMAMPLSLLRLVGNPVVSATKNYRKSLMIQMPTLMNLDDMPCFPKDRRLAEAFMSGGAQAESAERLKIKQEEQDAREKSRQAFNDMVALAKEQAAERARQQAALAEAASAVAADLANSVLSSALASAAQKLQREEEEAEIQQATSQLVQAVMQSVLASEQQQLKSAPIDDTEMEAESSEGMLVDDRDYSMSSVSDAGLNILNAQNSELEKKIRQMHVSLGGNSIQDELLHTNTTSSGPMSNQGLLAEIKSAGGGHERSTHAEGRTMKQAAKPAVWNTSRYKELWNLALKAGSEQEQAQSQGAPNVPEAQADCVVGSSNHHDSSDVSGNGVLRGDCVDAAPGGMGTLDRCMDIAFPLGSGLSMLRSYPVAQGSSSDGSDTQIGAHYPSAEEQAKPQEMAL